MLHLSSVGGVHRRSRASGRDRHDRQDRGVRYRCQTGRIVRKSAEQTVKHLRNILVCSEVQGRFAKSGNDPDPNTGRKRILKGQWPWSCTSHDIIWSESTNEWYEESRDSSKSAENVGYRDTKVTRRLPSRRVVQPYLAVMPTFVVLKRVVYYISTTGI